MAVSPSRQQTGRTHLACVVVVHVAPVRALHFALLRVPQQQPAVQRGCSAVGARHKERCSSRRCRRCHNAGKWSVSQQSLQATEARASRRRLSSIKRRHSTAWSRQVVRPPVSRNWPLGVKRTEPSAVCPWSVRLAWQRPVAVCHTRLWRVRRADSRQAKAVQSCSAKHTPLAGPCCHLLESAGVRCRLV